MSGAVSFAARLARAFAAGETMHAGVVVLHGRAVAIRGASGSGKSRLALVLIQRYGARLVADDRTEIACVQGRDGDAALIARPPAAIAGLMEIRGLGLVRQNFEPLARIRLIVDLVDMDDMPRLPNDEDRLARLLDVALPRLAVASGDPLAALIVHRAIVTRDRFGDDGVALSEPPPS